MIYAIVNNKGGAGKSTIAYHCLTALLENFNLVEIDDNNNTSSVFTKSVKLEKKIRSVKISKGSEAFDEAVFDTMKDGCNIIIDAGGGNDSIAVIEMLLKEADSENLTFIIPLMAGRAQLQNALDTYELVKDRKVVFVLNSGASKDDFVFWYGSDKYDLPGVDKKIQKLPTAFIPSTPLFDLAALDGEVIADIAVSAYLYGSASEVTNVFFDLANGDKEEFKRLKSRHRIAVAAKDFIENDLAEFKKVLLGA